MKIAERTIGDVHILDCSGKITLGLGTMAVRNSVIDILKIDGTRIVSTLADVNGIDIPGVGTRPHYHRRTGEEFKLRSHLH